jgi:hypothetical protein
MLYVLGEEKCIWDFDLSEEGNLEDLGVDRKILK